MDASAITFTTISVSGNDKLINFNSLSLNERMMDVNSFSFSWVPEDVDATFSDITAFKNKNLGQLVTISFLDGNASPNHLFRGFISQINSSITDDMSTSFQINGMGVFCTLTEKIECRSFSEKTIKDIISEVNPPNSPTTLKVNISNDNKHAFVVQYNQTAFEFVRMLAIRYGQWMYYDGKDLVFGDKPTDQPLKLDSDKDLDNISIYASTGKATTSAFAFDMKKGEITTSSAIEAAPSGSDLLKITDEASDKVFKSKGNGIYIPTSQTQEILDAKNKRNQQRTTAGNVFVSASSHNSKLSVGTVIAITDKKNSAGQHFIIMEISHSANNSHGYANNFTAIPLEVAVPNYTNPHFYARATIQPAIVVENVDKDGLDRITVRFPWMSKNEATPWIPVLTPYAGKNKGIRWLPEVDEEVMIDFLDNNAERPVMVGAFFTEKNKSGNDYAGNNKKVIGTRSGRRLVIDDNNGTLELMDDSKSGNYIGMTKSSDTTNLKITSGTGDDDFSVVDLNSNKKITIGVKSGGSVVVEMEYDAEAKKITLHSKGSIDIKADDSINMSAGSINLDAGSVSIKSDKGDVKIEGMNIKAKATANLEMEGTAQAKMKGAMVEVKGSGMGTFDGGGMATIKGGLVMIN